MSTNYPTSLDTLTNPAPGDSVLTVSHSAQHANANDAIEALEAKVGANGSAITTTHDYKLSGVTGTDKAASKTGTETLTNKTLTSPAIASPTVTGTLDATGATTNVTDSTFFIKDNASPTKIARFEASGITAGNTRVLTVPDANTTIAGTDATQTLTNKTMTGATNTVTASLLKSATTEVSISAATAPTVGQVLTAVNSTTATWQSPANGANILANNIIAGETFSVSAPLPVFIAPNGSVNDTIASDQSGTTSSFGYGFDNSGSLPIAVGGQLTGYGSIDTIKVNLQAGSNPSAQPGGVHCEIYADNGSNVPGTLLGTSNTILLSSFTAYFSGAAPQYSFTFPSNVSVSGKFWYMIIAVGVTGQNVQITAQASGGGTSRTASYNGSTYTVSSTGFQNVDAKVVLTAGAVYLSNSADSSRQRFDGFAVSNSTLGSPTAVYTDGIVGGFSGLTPGADYYVQSNSTAGTTSTSYKIGRAVTSSSILIRKF